MPDPVGAIRRMFSPVMILGIATVCGGVGFRIPESTRACWTASESSEKTWWDRVANQPQLWLDDIVLMLKNIGGTGLT